MRCHARREVFVAQRHDTIRDLLTSHISKVCRNVETEPLLQPLDNEVFNLQSTVTSRQARLDMKAGGFWTPGVTAFFGVRVTHVNYRSKKGHVHNYDLQRTRKREEEEIQPESDGCRDGNFYTTGVWYKRGHGTRLLELFKNSRKKAFD